MSLTELKRKLRNHALKGDVQSLCFGYLLDELLPGKNSSRVFHLGSSKKVTVRILEGDELNGLVVTFPSGRKYFLAENGLLMQHLPDGQTPTLYNPTLREHPQTGKLSTVGSERT
jgi:hypothetical protein